MSPKITVDGRDYDSPEQMPPDVRRVYEDALRQIGPMLKDQDGNDIPDIVEGKGSEASRIIVRREIVVNRESGSFSGEPIEPVSLTLGVRVLLVLFACAVGAVSTLLILFVLR